MPALFVAGPRDADEVREIVGPRFRYSSIEERLKDFGYEVMLPAHIVPTEDNAELWRDLDERIKRADQMFAFIGRRGTSTIIESGYAAHVHNKPQLIICHPEQRNSRLLRGLPNAGLIDGDQFEDVFQSCLDALKHHRPLDSGWMEFMGGSEFALEPA